MRNSKAGTAMRFSLALVIALTASAASAAPPAGYCEVTLCSKLEAPNLAEWNLPPEGTNESCRPAIVSEAYAVKNKKVESSTTWRPDGSRPARVAVTRVKDVKTCRTAMAVPRDKARS
jgi:hypothetical protein